MGELAIVPLTILLVISGLIPGSASLAVIVVAVFKYKSKIKRLIYGTFVHVVFPWLIMFSLAIFFTGLSNYRIWLFVAALTTIIPVFGLVLNITFLKSGSTAHSKGNLAVQCIKTPLGVIAFLLTAVIFSHFLFIIWDSLETQLSILRHDDNYRWYCHSTITLNRREILSASHVRPHQINSVKQAVQYSATLPEVREFIKTRPYADVKAWKSSGKYWIVWYIGYWWLRSDSESFLYDHVYLHVREDGSYFSYGHPYYGGS